MGYIKLIAWGFTVAIILQVIFYFVIQAIGYDAFSLSVLLIISAAIILSAIAVTQVIRKKLNST